MDPPTVDQKPQNGISWCADEQTLCKAFATDAVSFEQMENLLTDAKVGECHMAHVSKDQAVMIQSLPMNFWQADEHLHSFQPESLDLVIADEDSIIPPNNYFAVIQDSVASEEPVDSTKAWKITKDFGESVKLPSTHKLSVWDDGDRCIESAEILLRRSGMDSQPPPLDAALETEMALPRPHAALEDPQGHAPRYCISIGMLRSKIDAMRKHFDDARLRPDLPSLLPANASTPATDGGGPNLATKDLEDGKETASQEGLGLTASGVAVTVADELVPIVEEVVLCGTRCFLTNTPMAEMLMISRGLSAVLLFVSEMQFAVDLLMAGTCCYCARSPFRIL
ncbi:hypothetical protein Nepgr_024697 [Nepenthes gracilis]|uniref:Uncharacterized protein n=1 Tax=Nepenthes gracilis TaxID=150966 RepID=A0AAD3T4Y2_NEPGR|nr:hypothetical protein Nepgr_024697 [Nepenthes gracilis]